ncbi:MAG: hypothetical protein F6K28_28255, partial [Microcoleus sp. SIO2G3]|nr:hypothetical protein [Microcoleus sp. SIO2G3]
MKNSLKKAYKVLTGIGRKRVNTPAQVSTSTFSESSETSFSDLIDVKSLIQQLSVEELCQTAEDYFAKLKNWDYHLAKPFSSADDAPELLTCFSQVLQGLQILPGMTVLDFGSGSCWTS